ncbi:MAG TPA: isoprenylcysteine carboxylmethyltransferase family protein [Longimicrobiaceae bacterium]|jgi:protein-S-isoprenylcysteine O-methyltransferase Ste14|nr:isoprenylcysteine carboxylmethyltransferase family protein [Longimicrobiaceae bacterium]
MRRTSSVLGSILFLFVAPGFVAGVAPRWISRWEMRPPLLGFEAMRWIGGLVLALGMVLLIDAFARFALEGRGTPAPVAPTERLVVTGPYRFVRNPMYVAVVSLILGQGLLLGQTRVLVYGALVWLLMHLFVLAYEEPTLRASFPDDYAAFTRHVPRWLPRLGPWRG